MFNIKKKPLKVLIQMDPLKKINKSSDSTFKLLLEAIKREYLVMICNPRDLLFADEKVKVFAKKILLSQKKNSVVEKEKKILCLDEFDVVLIRQDPPFDMNYITNTYLFDLNIQISHKKIFYINHPSSVRNLSEKIYPLQFPDIIPPTILTSRSNEMLSFLKRHKKIVLKPLYDKGGNGIFVIDENDYNIENIFKTSSQNFVQKLILQKFLSNVSKGDKRVILINGEPVGVVNRVPNKGNFRANLNLGGKAKKTLLTPKEKIICKKIKNSLIKNNFFFVGIDLIDEKLTEINVTSPTGIVQINKLEGKKIEKIFWDQVVKKISTK